MATSLHDLSIGSPDDGFAQLLHIDGGITAVEKTVYDGDGTATAVELSTLKFNITGTLQLGGVDVTSTAAELNILDGVTSTAAELNILDGVTSTAAELNILDGVTATTAEINYLDGVTSNIQTQIDAISGVDTFGTPVANDFARFTDADTIEGRSYAEVKADLSLDNVENTALSTWAGTANITTLGTIGTGTWNAGAVTSSSDIKANTSNYVVEGGSSRGVLRSFRLSVLDGTNANTLKIRMEQNWNSSDEADTNNVSKGATTGNYTLSADGEDLTIESGALDGTVVGFLTSAMQVNESGTYYTFNAQESSGELMVRLIDNSGTRADWTSVVDSGTIRGTIIYVTSS